MKNATNKHTPGPWKTDRAGVNVVDPKEKSEYVLAFCKGSSLQEIQANARLIASAPDLLAALERAVSVLEDLPYPQGAGAFEQARSAIAKARGEA